MSSLRRAIVLLSGGADSTISAYLARLLFDDLHAVAIDYGQRHRTELDASAAIARLLGASFDVLPMPALGVIADSALVQTDRPIAAAGGRPDAAAPAGLPTSFVPGRNGIFLMLAAAVAVREGARDIITGICETDFSGYPDCRGIFVSAIEDAITKGMPSGSGPFRIHAPLMHMSKAASVRVARRIPGCWEALALTVSCYEGRRPGCGACPSCVLRARGFEEAGEVDPAGEPRVGAES